MNSLSTSTAVSPAPSELRLCHIIDSLGRGGTQRCLVYLVRGLAERNYRQHVICLNDDVDQEIHAALAEVANVIVIGKRSLLLGTGLTRIFRLLRRERIQIVQSYLWHADIIGRITARLARVPAMLSSIRARNVDKPIWQFWMDRATIQWTARVIFNSRNVIAFSERNEGVPPEKAVYIPNGVALVLPASSQRAEQRARLGLNPQSRLLLSVGRLAEQKGHNDLLAAFARIAARHTDVHLVVLGEGPQRPELERTIDSLQLKSRVSLPGVRQDVAPWLAVADAFALASHYEGMPNALMEAMAAGLPAVVTQVDGNSELVTDRKTGLLVPVGQPEQLAHALDEVLTDPVFSRSLGKAAADFMRENYSVEKMVGAYDQVYRETLASTA